MIDESNIIVATDIATIGTATTSVAILSQVKEWIGIAFSIVSVVALIVGILLRIITASAKARDPESDGGEKITAKEVEEIVSDLERQTAIIDQISKDSKERIKKLKGE